MNRETRRGISFALIGVMLFTGLFIIIGYAFKLFRVEEEPKYYNVQVGGVYDGDGNELESGKTYSMLSALAFTVPTVETYAAADGITICATLKDTNGNNVNEATNAAVDWSVAFKNPESTWATGKLVTNYVTVTPSGSSVIESQSATVLCKNGFSEQIVITAAARANPDIKATCTVDYLQKITDFSLSFGSVNCNFNGNTNVPVELIQSGTAVGGLPRLSYTFGDGTIRGSQPTVTYDLISKGGFFERGYRDLNDGNFAGDFPDFLDFGEYSTGGVIVRGAIHEYAVSNLKTQGLYFGIQWFVENLGLHHFQSGRGNYIQNEVYNVLSAADMIYRFTHSNGTDNEYYYKGLELFELQVTISNEITTYTKTTTFVMNSYTAVADVRGIEIDNAGITF